MKQRHKIAETLEQFRNLKGIPKIKTVRKKVLIVKMVNKDGETENDRMGIANIFADFYEQLYTSRRESHIQVTHDEGCENITSFTREDDTCAWTPNKLL